MRTPPSQKLAYNNDVHQLTLSLLQPSHILSVLVRKTLEEGILIKIVRHAGFLLFPRRRTEIFLIRIEQAREAANKGRPDLFWVEGNGTGQGDLLGAAVVHHHIAARTLVHRLVRFFVAKGACALFIQGLRLQAMAFHERAASCVWRRLVVCIWHNC